MAQNWLQCNVKYRNNRKDCLTTCTFHLLEISELFCSLHSLGVDMFMPSHISVDLYIPPSHTHTHAHTNTNTHLHTHTNTLTLTHKHTHTHTQTHSHTQT